MNKSTLAILLIFSACFIGCKSSDSDKKEDKPAPSSGALSNLQACSYEGSPISIDPSKFNFAGGATAVTSMISEIMKFSGLPQNFEVIETEEVPNAAALILKGDDGLPKRVIAYNPKFMDIVNKATQNNNWAPLSILAHEVGHHLCGHTIMPGGSQPPTELEADKFSGFVLYKMGAALSDAQKAMEALSPDKDGPTHPGKGKRIVAIEDGWKQACTQQSSDCSGDAVTAIRTPSPTGQPVASPEPANDANKIPEMRSIDTGNSNTPTINTDNSGAQTNVQPQTAATAQKPDVLPAPSDNAVPTKFDKFVYDEVGVMTAADKAKLVERLYGYASKHNIEIVAIIAKSLHGKTANDYASSMMRQLRIGKLEIGNGVCMVVAPNEKEVGLSLMPGLYFEVNEASGLKTVTDNLRTYLNEYILNKQKMYSFNIELAASEIKNSADILEWAVRHENFKSFMDIVKQELESSRNGQRIDIKDSKVWRKMVRVSGTLVAKDGFKTIPDKHKWQKTDYSVDWISMEVKTDDGTPIIVYTTKMAEFMMPSKLEEGKNYSFVLREFSTIGDYPSFHLISYDKR